MIEKNHQAVDAEKIMTLKSSTSVYKSYGDQILFNILIVPYLSSVEIYSIQYIVSFLREILCLIVTMTGIISLAEKRKFRNEVTVNKYHITTLY